MVVEVASEDNAPPKEEMREVVVGFGFEFELINSRWVNGMDGSECA